MKLTTSSLPLVYLPVGKTGIFLIDPATPYPDRQELASCIQDVVGKLGELIGCASDLDNDARCLGWAVAYLNGLSKSLLDSMDLREKSA